MKAKQEEEKCLVCGAPAVWVRSTQFAGDHPYCAEHAEDEPDFVEKDDSYKVWYQLDN